MHLACYVISMVGEHSIIDGDCDFLISEKVEFDMVGEHSIIDGDCDPIVVVYFFAHPGRRAFHN